MVDCIRINVCCHIRGRGPYGDIVDSVLVIKHFVIVLSRLNTMVLRVLIRIMGEEDLCDLRQQQHTECSFDKLCVNKFIE